MAGCIMGRRDELIDKKKILQRIICGDAKARCSIME